MIGKYQGWKFQQIVQPANRDNRQKSEVLIKQDPRQGQTLFHIFKSIHRRLRLLPKRDQPFRHFKNAAIGVPRNLAPSA